MRGRGCERGFFVPYVLLIAAGCTNPAGERGTHQRPFGLMVPQLDALVVKFEEEVAHRRGVEEQLRRLQRGGLFFA
jgi:hypothetical protein